MAPTVADLLKYATAQLLSFSETPRLDAELIVMHCCALNREQLVAYPDTKIHASQENCIRTLIKRRQTHEPIAYLLGHKEFWSLPFKVTPAVLIPRPETEHLVEWILDFFPADGPIKLADLGTGSGAIAIAIAKERPHWAITATDISPEALNLAKHNAQQLKIKNVHFYLGDWLTALPSNAFHCIVSNPPYLAANDPYLKKLMHEPTNTALIANDHGRAALAHIAKNARNYLMEEGILVLEHGHDQGTWLTQHLIELNYQEVSDHQDYAGHPRFCSAVFTKRSWA